MSLSKQQSAALHTLWQAAVGSGGIGAVATALNGGSINLSGVQQGAGVAGIAVAAAALSVAKSTAINWIGSHKQNQALKDAFKVEALAKAVGAYQAAHSAPAVAA